MIGVVLRGDHDLRPGGRAQDGGRVQGLDRGTLMTETDTSCSPSARAAASAAASIMPLANRATSSPGHDDLGLAEPQHVALAEDHRDLTALEPDVDRPRDVHDGLDDLADLDRVGDIDHGHPGRARISATSSVAW